MFSDRLKDLATRSMEDATGNAGVAANEMTTLPTTNPAEGQFEDPFVDYDNAMEDAFQAQVFQDIVLKHGGVPQALVGFLNADGSLEEFMPNTFLHAGQENLSGAAIESITSEINEIVGVEAEGKKSFWEKAAAFASRAKDNFKNFLKMLGKRKDLLLKWGKSVHPYYKIGAMIGLGLAAGAAGGYAYKKRNARIISHKNLMELISALSYTKKAVEAIGKTKVEEGITDEVEKALANVEAFSLKVEKDKAKIVKGSLPKPESKELVQLGYGDSSFKEAAEAYKEAIAEYTAAIDMAQKMGDEIGKYMDEAEKGSEEAGMLAFKLSAISTVMKRADDVNYFLKTQIERLGRKYTNKDDSEE